MNAWILTLRTCERFEGGMEPTRWSTFRPAAELRLSVAARYSRSLVALRCRGRCGFGVVVVGVVVGSVVGGGGGSVVGVPLPFEKFTLTSAEPVCPIVS